MLEMVSANNPDAQTEYDILNIYDMNLDLNLIRLKASIIYYMIERASLIFNNQSHRIPFYCSILKRSCQYAILNPYFKYCNILYPYAFMNKYVKCHWMFRKGCWPTRPSFARRALRPIIRNQNRKTYSDLIYRNSLYGTIGIDYLISRGLL